ncbi:MAG: c-type cytochrome [Pseudomonadales bacterium]|nr:c-type cytochrome [Pseudomonadales bacterium]
MKLTRSIRKLLALTGLAVLGSLIQSAAMAQSTADNIRPVGQVCMAGQPCEGSTAGGGSAVAGSAPAASVAAAPEPAAPAAAEETVVEETTEVAAAESAFDAAGAYQMSCFACHGTGAAGAPQPGDAEVWEERMAKGMEAVMANVINGVNAMPARGICMTCSDDDLQAIVDYMLAQ